MLVQVATFLSMFHQVSIWNGRRDHTRLQSMGKLTVKKCEWESKTDYKWLTSVEWRVHLLVFLFIKGHSNVLCRFCSVSFNSVNANYSSQLVDSHENHVQPALKCQTSLEAKFHSHSRDCIVMTSMHAKLLNMTDAFEWRRVTIQLHAILIFFIFRQIGSEGIKTLSCYFERKFGDSWYHIILVRVNDGKWCAFSPNKIYVCITRLVFSAKSV